MKKLYSEILSENKILKLKIWRGRYSREEYPSKVALNTLYEMLIVEKMWIEIQSPYNKSQSHRSNFKDFQQAHTFIMGRSESIALGEVHPIIKTEYINRESIAGLNWESVKKRVDKAQNGDNDEVREIELTYYFYTCGVELIYAWSALGYFNGSQEDAFFELAGMIIGGVDYSAYESLVHSFGQAASMFYKPLPDLF